MGLQAVQDASDVVLWDVGLLVNGFDQGTAIEHERGGCYQKRRGDRLSFRWVIDLWLCADGKCNPRQGIELLTDISTIALKLLRSC